MRDDETNRTISAIERAQAELRESIAESDRLGARADALVGNARRAMTGGGGEQAQA